jgi:hypothetical protein
MTGDPEVINSVRIADNAPGMSDTDRKYARKAFTSLF